MGDFYINKLIAAGADVNLQDNKGKTALMWALKDIIFIYFDYNSYVTRCHMLNELFAAGADVLLKNLKDKSVWDIINSKNGKILVE